MPLFEDKNDCIVKARQWPSDVPPVDESTVLWLALNGISLLEARPPEYVIGHVDSDIQWPVGPGDWVVVRDGFISVCGPKGFSEDFTLIPEV